MRVAGVMSGTSVDAIDVAVCDLQPDPPDGLVMRLMGYREEPWQPELRRRVLALAREPAVPLDALIELTGELGHAFGTAVGQAVERLGLPMAAIDLIASHGQTVYHLVEPGRRRGTLQLGEPAIIAAITGVTVVADFRVADIAAGGEGAPLASFLDALLFGGSPLTRAIQNLGGIANVTFLPAVGQAYAFDTGPGNVPIDHAARILSGGRQTCDRDGAMAAAGRVDEELLEEILAHPYFSRPPPKSTGRELFGDAFAEGIVERAGRRGLSPNDTMATLTALTAESIARAYRDFGPSRIDELVLGGGGASNPTLVREIAARAPVGRIVPRDETLLPPAAREAVAFAVLGHEALHGRPAGLPRCTGASRPAILGKIVPGDNYRELMRRVYWEEGGACEAIRRVRLRP